MLGLMLGELQANDVSVETKLDDNLPDVTGNPIAAGHPQLDQECH